jgi:hypothetical protein
MLEEDECRRNGNGPHGTETQRVTRQRVAHDG